MAIPDYSNIKFDISSMNSFFKDQGVNIAANDTAKLNTIFKECDTEGAKNEKGENIGDGVLRGQERTTFLNKIKSACPQIYDKVVDFFSTVEKTEDIAATKEETYQRLKNEQKANDKAQTESNIKFGLDSTTVQKWEEEAAKELEKENAEITKKVERLELILNFRTKWTGEIDNKTLTAQLKELKNINDKENLDKKLMEFNTQNQNQIIKNSIKFGLDDQNLMEYNTQIQNQILKNSIK